jgi:hypothetical protein
MTEQALELLVDLHENILMDDNIEESCLAFRDESLTQMLQRLCHTML